MMLAKTFCLILPLLGAAQAALKDFVIENEDDVRRLAAANDVAQLGDDDEQSDYDADGLMYDSCGNSRLGYGGYDAPDSDDEQNALAELVQNGLIDLPALRRLLAQLASDPDQAKRVPSIQMVDHERSDEQTALGDSCAAHDIFDGDAEGGYISEQLFHMH